MEMKSVSLYYSAGSSDKEYRVWTEVKDDGVVVHFAYGRRGAALTTGTKTKAPVEYGAAVAILEKLVTEKKSKGYTEGEDGTPYQHSDRQVSGLLPQLLNTIDDTDVALIVDDPAWAMQEKRDGRRMMLRKTGQTVEGINKLGLLVGVPRSIVDWMCSDVRGDVILDGEIIGDQLYAFDVIHRGGVDLRDRPYRDRYGALTDLLDVDSCLPVSAVDCWTDPVDKARQLAAFKAAAAEGVVFKRWSAPYTVGRPNSGGPQLKYKFVATLSAVVSKINRQRSVGISLLDGQQWQPVGNVTIPANLDVPPVGAVVEVRYLYAAPALVQPVYLGQRSDVEPHECVTRQLKYKAA